MKSVAIIFVPASAKPEEFVAVLREHLTTLEIGEARSPQKTIQPESDNTNEPPRWTWFLPNPCPAPF